jgi:tetrahydromethanopterin S-methyltransferase subunit H
MAEECGITKPFMDVAITPLGQGAGPALRTSYAVKSKWGLPVGSGIHNVPSAWDWLRGYKKPVDKGGQGHAEAWPVCDVGSNLIQQTVGGDFVLSVLLKMHQWLSQLVVWLTSSWLKQL